MRHSLNDTAYGEPPTSEPKKEIENPGCGCVVLLLCIPLGIFSNAYAMTLLWAWFVTPFGLSQLTIPHAIGLSMLKKLAAIKRHKPSKEATFRELLMAIAIGPAILVGVGYCAHLFM